MAQPVYPFDIPSISHLHPGIPANVVDTLRLAQNIVIGDPIDPLDAKRAEGAATSLTHLQGEYIIHFMFPCVLTQLTTSARAGHYR